VSEQHIGHIIDGLGLEMDLQEDDLVANVMVIAKVIRADGSTAIAMASDEAMSWLDRLGIVTAAGELVRTEMLQPCTCDDED
jgi:hypothetical protein